MKKKEGATLCIFHGLFLRGPQLLVGGLTGLPFSHQVISVHPAPTPLATISQMGMLRPRGGKTLDLGQPTACLQKSPQPNICEHQ